MKPIVVLSCVLLCIPFSSCDIPNVFEFCTALMTDKSASCRNNTCLSRPGKRGERGFSGVRGQKGTKGDQGPSGSTVALKYRIALLEGSNRVMANIISPEDKLKFCSLGMSSRRIPDSAITVSSSYSGYEGRYARLDAQRESGNVYAGWHPKTASGAWIQIDLGSSTSVSGLVTQGRPECCAQWVTSYKVACGTQENSMQTMTETGEDKVFSGNSDRDTKVTNMFPSVMSCRYIKVYPQSYHDIPVMRLEILRGDCFSLY